MSERAGGFVWYELMTSDVEGAEAFYGTVLGWNLADSGMPGVSYTLASAGASRVAGLMPTPRDVEAAGAKPAWFGYVAVPDVDAYAERVTQAGGAIHRGPADIPGVGRFAVAADPQGAVFVLFRAHGAPQEPLPYMTPGTVGWHELHAKDWAQAYSFYAPLFGWQKGEALEMGPMGTYQLLGAGSGDFGAMFTNAEVPRPFWLYYVSVGDIDAAAARIAEAGGMVTHGPSPVPGGMWILHLRDPQGAMLGLVGTRPNA